MKTIKLISALVLTVSVMSSAFAASSSGTITFGAMVIDSSKLCDVKFNAQKDGADKTVDTKSCNNSSVNINTRSVKVASKSSIESNTPKSVTTMSYL